MQRIDLTTKEFNELVKYLKRLDDIGDNFFLKNDIICPSTICEQNKPGKHVVRGIIPILPEYEDVIFGIADLSETSRALGDIKGRKTEIYMEESHDGIWIYVNGVSYRLAGVYVGEDTELAPEEKHFDDYLERHSWTEIPNEMLTRIKRGDVHTLEDANKTTYVRVGRDLFKLKGVSRLSAPVDYKAFCYISSPISSPETLVIGNSGYGTFELHTIYPIIESISFYLFDPFH